LGGRRHVIYHSIVGVRFWFRCYEVISSPAGGFSSCLLFWCFALGVLGVVVVVVVVVANSSALWRVPVMVLGFCHVLDSESSLREGWVVGGWLL
jgi:hypothetical protein